MEGMGLDDDLSPRECMKGTIAVTSRHVRQRQRMSVWSEAKCIAKLTHTNAETNDSRSRVRVDSTLTLFAFLLDSSCDLWRLTDNTLIVSLQHIDDICFSHGDGQQFACIEDFTYILSIWDANSGTCRLRIVLECPCGVHTSFSSDNSSICIMKSRQTFLLVGCSVALYDSLTGDKLAESRCPTDKPNRSLISNTNPNTTLFADVTDNSCFIWEFQNSELVNLATLQITAMAVAFTADDLIFAGYKNTVYCFCLNSHQTKLSFLTIGAPRQLLYSNATDTVTVVGYHEVTVFEFDVSKDNYEHLITHQYPGELTGVFQCTDSQVILM
jgi:hypothetical protein